MSDSDSDVGLIRMEQGNYGGHYVIVAEKLKGEYYIQVSSMGETTN